MKLCVAAKSSCFVKALIGEVFATGKRIRYYSTSTTDWHRPRPRNSSFSDIMESAISNIAKKPKLDLTNDGQFPRPGVGVGVFVTSPDYPGCIILGKRRNSTGAGLYALPGGHLEFGESWEECGRRETMEETGLKLKDVSFAYVNNAFHKPLKYHYVTIFMKGEVDTSFKVEPENTEPDKCEGWHWTKWEDIPAPDKLFWSLRVTLKEGFHLFGPKT